MTVVAPEAIALRLPPRAAPPDQAAARDLRDALKTPIMLCILVLLGFFGALIGWSVTAPLSSAAIAQGVLSPEGSRKTIQHLEGGIIKEIRVREGDKVAKGDLLVLLEETQSRASFFVQQSQYLRLTAMKMRIEALQQRATSLDFNATFEKQIKTDPDFAAFIANEKEIFEARRRTLEQQQQIYVQQIGQLKEEIRGYEAQIDSTKAQLAFIEDELKDQRQLLDQGLARKPRVLELERMRANLVGNEGQLVSSVAKARQKISEILLNQVDLENKFFNETNELLTKTNTDRAQVEERINAAQDILTRIEIRAPIAGIVVNLRFRTNTGVVKPGEAILDIVPTDEDLVIEARVSPNDIDVVKAGQVAQIHLTPFHARYTNMLKGTLRDISADTLTDDKTGTKYFRAYVVVDHNSISELGPNAQLTAGMPAEVFIRTGEHTLITYLIEPFTRSLRRSFREK